MESDQNKGKPLSKEETKALVALIENSRIINNKCTNASSNKLKTEEWRRITDSFNATISSSRRTPQQLRLKWENLKKNARKRSTRIRMNNIQTGGGASNYIPLDDILDHVSSLLGSTVDGFTVEFGGDGEVKKKIVDVEVEIIESSVNTTEAPIIISQEIAQPIIEAPAETEQKQKQTLYLNTPSTSGKRKQYQSRVLIEKSQAERNQAIADYFKKKTAYLDAKIDQILLENKKLKSDMENSKGQN